MPGPPTTSQKRSHCSCGFASPDRCGGGRPRPSCNHTAGCIGHPMLDERDKNLAGTALLYWVGNLATPRGEGLAKCPNHGGDLQFAPWATGASMAVELSMGPDARTGFRGGQAAQGVGRRGRQEPPRATWRRAIWRPARGRAPPQALPHYPCAASLAWGCRVPSTHGRRQMPQCVLW